MKCISLSHCDVCLYCMLYTQIAYYYLHIYFTQVHIFNTLGSRSLSPLVTIFTCPFYKAHEYQINVGMFIIYFIFISLFAHSYAVYTNSHRIKKLIWISLTFTLIKNFIKKYFSRRRHIFFTVWFSVVNIAVFFTVCRLYACCSLFCLKQNFDEIFLPPSRFLFLKITSQFFLCYWWKIPSRFSVVHRNFNTKISYDDLLYLFVVLIGKATQDSFILFLKYLLIATNLYANANFPGNAWKIAVFM